MLGKPKFAMLTICAVFIFWQPVGRAQADTATITGRVLDPLNATIPNATITILNVDTQITHQTVTNNDGLFVVSGLLPGNYRIEAGKAGFKTVIKPDVVLHIQDVVAINFNMIVGSVSESVTVGAGAPLVNTESGAVSTVVDRQFVENLPMNGRSFNTLLQLTPGAVMAAQGPNGELGQFSVNGQRNDANYFTVDGVGANFGTNALGSGQGFGGAVPAFNALGGTSSLVSVDAMQEFRIQTSSFAPEYGHQPGGQVAIETRSGTSEFHGDAFNYFRNKVLDANDWFANAAGKPRAPENQNDFGGVLGGPVIIPGLYDGQDKTFFFFSYEGLRLRQPQNQLVLVPTLATRASAVPAAAQYLNAFPKPDPNAPDLGDGSANLTASWSNRITLDATSLRIDHRLGLRWNAFGRFNDSPSQIVSRPGGVNEIDVTNVNTRTVTLGLNGAVSQNLSNSFRVNYSTQSAGATSSLDSFGGGTPPNISALFPSPLIPSDSRARFGIRTSSQYLEGLSARTMSTQMDLIDDFGVSLGAHHIKFGVDERALWMNRAGSSSLTYFASTPAKFASSATADGGISSVFSMPVRVLLHSFSLYGQDTWKIGQRLTLTYGLRWELNPAPDPLGSTFLPSWQNLNDPSTIVLAPVGTPAWKTTYGNVTPRLGIAYRLNRTGDFVLRGGIGSYYDTVQGMLSTLLSSYPIAASIFDFNPSDLTLPRPNLNGLIPSTSIQPPYQSFQLAGISPDLQLPRSYQWNVSLEKAFGQQSISLTYVGQVGSRLLHTQIFYPPASNANFRPGSDFILTSNGDSSNYSALQWQYRRPLTKSLQVLANYTWGHSIDTNSSDAAFNGSDQIVPTGANRGSSDFDVRQNVTGAFTYDLPGSSGPELLKAVTKGWSLSLVAQARTGLPINVTSQQLSVLGYFAPSRPDLVSGQPIWIEDSTRPGGKYLNPAAFALPSSPRQGDLARNSIQGFGMTQFDLSAARLFPFTERMKVQFRSDIFNVANHPNFTNPSGAYLGPTNTRFLASRKMLNQGLGGLNSLYQAGGPRSVQFSLKLLF